MKKSELLIDAALSGRNVVETAQRLFFAGTVKSPEIQHPPLRAAPRRAALKDVGEVVACVVDYGTFISLAEKLAQSMRKVYYYSPYEQEYLDLAPCIRADGLSTIQRVDEVLDPDFIKKVDLFVFPDRGYGGLQRHLRYECKKAVWGSMGVSDMEEYRTLFVDMLRKQGMPIVKSIKIQGISKLGEYLKGVKDKWIKIDRFRACMETWHHLDYAHSQRTLEKLSKSFGPAKNYVWFVVQDHIDTDVEVGYDGWCVDGQYPPESYQGYEAKNELYLGSKLSISKQPDEVKYVNQQFAPMLKKIGYRNFWATEIRVKDDTPYFIDPTARMPGQTGEQLLETCANLGEVIWQGANGVLATPKFAYDYAAEATLHYTAGDPEDWKTINVPKAVSRWIKLYHYCYIDKAYHIVPAHASDELGVMLGVGSSVEKALDHLKRNMELLKDEPVEADLRAFAGLLHKVKEAEKQGIKFGKKKVPEPEIVLK